MIAKARKRRGFPSCEEIASAQRWFTKSLPNVVTDPARSCWACGFFLPDWEPERAHVTARANGGTNAPENFFLLCSKCHDEHPDGQDRATQEAWLHAHESFRARVARESTETTRALRAEAGRLCGEKQARGIVLAWMMSLGAVGMHRIVAAARRRTAGSKNVRANDLAALLAHLRATIESDRCRMPPPVPGEDEQEARAMAESAVAVIRAQGAEHERVPWDPTI